MSKLQKLYSIIENSRELGLELGEDVLRQTAELEEKIIKKEILPVVSAQIEPTLQQIKRNLVLVVDYVPGEPLKVKLSRRAKLENIADLVDLTPDPQAQHSTRNSTNKTISRAKASKLIVHLPGGRVIQEDTAAQTLVEAIRRADPLKVRALGIVCCRVPLVSTTKDHKYGDTQVDVGNGLYVITHSNNKMKKGFLERISKSLDLSWVIELVK